LYLVLCEKKVKKVKKTLDSYRFLKNYEYICGKDIDDNFFVNVLANKKLKSDFSYGFISKEEFFNTVKGY